MSIGVHLDTSHLLMFQKAESDGGLFFKVVKRCSVVNLFLSISVAYNVISCRKVAENTKILKIAKGRVRKIKMEIFNGICQ